KLASYAEIACASTPIECSGDGRRRYGPVRTGSLRRSAVCAVPRWRARGSRRGGQVGCRRICVQGVGRLGGGDAVRGGATRAARAGFLVCRESDTRAYRVSAVP